MPRGLADGFTPGVGKFILRFTLILVWGYTKVMIRSIRGKIIARTPPKIVVEASGLGYGVNVPLSALETLSDDQEIFLYIYHHLSEDRSDLYGFLKPDQRDFFELLLTVSGVGPKVALAIINSNGVDVLRSAIAEGQSQVFANASGVGRKIAERIIVDLKSKISIQPGLASGYGDTFEALRSLGYSAAEVKRALSEVPAGVEDVHEQIKLALKALARK